MPKSRVSPAAWKKLSVQEQQKIIADRAKQNGGQQQVQQKKQKAKKKAQPKKSGKAVMNKDLQVVPIAMSPTQKRVMNVNASIALGSINEAFLTLAAFLGIKGVFSDTTTTGLGLPGPVIYSGLAWLMQGVNTAAVGGSQLLTQAPRVAVDLLNALKPKEVGYHKYFKISYGWNQYDPTVPLLPLNVGNGVFALTYEDPLLDAGLYNTLLVNAASYAGNQDQYASFLKVVGNLVSCAGLKIVDVDGRSMLSNDVSSWARSYRYCGLSPVTTNGYYKDLENEVNITAPMYSAFCNYVTPDVRVPRKLQAFAFGPNLSMGWPLHTSYTTPWNKVNPVGKQLDFEEFYCYLTQLMCRAKEIGQNSPIDQTYVQPLPFSQQDFRILLRQALLSLYQDSQFLTQFEASVAYNPGGNSFVPFLCTPGTAARAVFQQMIVPSLFAENVNALRSRSIKIGGKSSRNNVATFFPILGRYFDDEPLVPQYSLDGVMTPLFTTIVQDPINLTDMAVAGGYVNPNCSYYQGVLQDWNTVMNGLAAVMGETGNIMVDSGATGLGLLYVTKVQEKSSAEERHKIVKRRPYPGHYNTLSLRNVENIETRTIERKDSKTKLGPLVIPSASVLDLCSITLLSAVPLTSEEENFIQNIITPVVRLDDQEDALTCPMYQTIVSEPASTPLSASVSGFGIGVYSNLYNYAGWSVTGVGKDQTNTYTEMFKTLQSEGKAGLIANLIGGVVKGFAPGAAGTIDTIASLVPF